MKCGLRLLLCCMQLVVVYSVQAIQSPILVPFSVCRCTAASIASSNAIHLLRGQSLSLRQSSTNDLGSINTS